VSLMGALAEDNTRQEIERVSMRGSVLILEMSQNTAVRCDSSPPARSTLYALAHNPLLPCEGEGILRRVQQREDVLIDESVYQSSAVQSDQNREVESSQADQRLEEALSTMEETHLDPVVISDPYWKEAIRFMRRSVLPISSMSPAPPPLLRPSTHPSCAVRVWVPVVNIQQCVDRARLESLLIKPMEGESRSGASHPPPRLLLGSCPLVLHLTAPPPPNLHLVLATRIVR
jgi:hypothetical protein